MLRCFLNIDVVNIFQIREDVKAGVYVENLTEHGVCTMNDVRLLLIKVWKYEVRL